MSSEEIKSVKAREILDSRGNPTVEVELKTEEKSFIASVPSGASTGKYEAKELRDKGDERYNGKGVLKAVKNVNEIIAPNLVGKNPEDQEEIDKLMIDLDGTEDKSNLGANTILPVSIAICRAGASAKNLPLYKYITQIFNLGYKLQVTSYKIPLPCFNIINGGAHAGNDLDIQEFMIIPQEDSFSQNLQAGSEIYHNLKEILEKNLGEETVNIGDEGGFAPPISRAEEALDFVSRSFKDYKNTKIGLDCAATQFYKNENYNLEDKNLSSKELSKFYQDLINKYPIIFIEDPFAEDDWQSWKELSTELVLIVGDDLLSTNIKRMKQAQEKSACNGLILKPNQIGTITEALEAAKLAKSYGWKIIVSHRSGETKDDFIADLAVGIAADFIKSGAPARGERMAKYNRLLKIEEEIRSGS